MTRVLAIPAALLLGSCSFITCPHEAKLQERADGSDLQKVQISSAYGWVKVRGVEEATDVRAEGRACAPDSNALAQIELDVRREDDVVFVDAVIPQLDRWAGTLDIEVVVPAGSHVVVFNRGGDVEIEGVASTQIENNDGRLKIRDVRGEVRIADGYDDISVQRVGSVVLEADEGGKVAITETKGDVELRTNRSDSVSLQRIGGEVKRLR